MPIEIRELVIKATVKEQIHSPQLEREKAREKERLKREILNLCKEQIRDMLKDQQNR
ncbi:MAG: DUF5908 family protein [Bacteroidota bacterium]